MASLVSITGVKIDRRTWHEISMKNSASMDGQIARADVFKKRGVGYFMKVHVASTKNLPR
ncbi:MAG: hypothetical protein WC717_04750 [Candidatus Micrarchaeia archaeon]